MYSVGVWKPKKKLNKEPNKQKKYTAKHNDATCQQI